MTAPAHLLDREAPADYLREWTERIASENAQVESGRNSVVVFRVGTEWLALPTRVFEEVAESCSLHTIPHRRSGIVAGMVTIRGQLLLCASLAALLRGDGATAGTAKPPDHQRMLVASHDGQRVAFLIDEVYGVLRYHPRELQPLPATLARTASTYSLGLLPWNERTVGCLDHELLFYTLNKSFA